MFKKMLKLLGKGCKQFGEGVIELPKILIDIWKKAIRKDSAGGLVFAVFATPFLILASAFHGIFLSAIGAFMAAAVVLVMLPIAAIVDIIKALNACTHTENVPEQTWQVQRGNIENPQPFSTTVQVLNALPKNDTTVDLLDAYTSYTQAYIDSFKNKPSHSDRINTLKLSQEETNLLIEACLDPITKNVIDIAVRMNDKIYDLATLEKILSSGSQDPFTKLSFKRRDIQPARDVNEKIQHILEQIIENRNISNNESIATNQTEIKNMVSV